MENQPLLSYINFFRACCGTVSPFFCLIFKIDRQQNCVPFMIFHPFFFCFIGEVLRHKEAIEKKHEDSKYDENEINGKFRITSEQWNENLKNENSVEYQDLSKTLKTGLKDMLMEDEGLSEKADFDVEIVKLT